MACSWPELLARMDQQLRELGVFVMMRSTYSADVTPLPGDDDGDVVTDLHQISVAFGHAAVAACAVHHSLPPRLAEMPARTG